MHTATLSLTAGLVQGMQPGLQPPQALPPDYAAYQAPYRQGGAVGYPHAPPVRQYAQQYKDHEVQHAGGQGSLGGAASPYASMSYIERLQVQARHLVLEGWPCHGIMLCMCKQASRTYGTVQGRHVYVRGSDE